MLNSRESHSDIVLQDHHFGELCNLVYQHTGITLAESKKQLVQRRFSPRIRDLGMSGFDDYVKLIKSGDEGELVKFTNAITTNLTSFFRENHHFEFLKNECIPAILKRNTHEKRVRIWSAGCSTGPEPYCLAMVLMESIPDIEKWDAKILATDLDTKVLETASAGIYDENTLETVSRERLQRWFNPLTGEQDKQYQVNSQLKSLIRFNPLNLLGPFPMSGRFDVIICRNVFIYFDKPTQKEIIKKFANHQSEGDTLIVGHSENLSTVTSDYELSGQTVYTRLA